ncbi:GNAT family N-acetyltransferase [Anaerostipes sp.]|uniref:GNAT family N-acetyltransferase n=1 Tax=Anaerostipes sp. TaxID=1872530 RepID=UPI0025BD7573|nr:GNAT family N-acetyltransferase [Anaerostipes sp.]MBS7009799.1 GNAT family N-acetyltransferase [Anaerostipes sp.]
MKIFEIQDRTEMLINQLYKIWERSVKATHLFLSDQEIEKIAEYVPTAIREIPHLIIAEDDDQTPAAFMGIGSKKLEMLFIDPEKRGTGLGRELVRFGISVFSVNELGVNEQNPHARGFYEHMGFQVYKRTDTDEQGNPYPILYMRLP